MAHDLHLGGEKRPGSSAATFAVVNPSTGEAFAEVASATADDAVAAVAAAAAVQPAWASTPPRQRSEILRAAWQAMLDHSDELATLIVRESGKPMSDAVGEVAYGAEFFRWNAEEAVRIRGTVATSPSGANRMLVHHPPVGVVLMVTPWNFPAAMITRKVAPALAAGNAVVVKPPPETPLTALRLVALLENVGLPPGLVNVIPTDDAAAVFDAAVDQRPVRMVSFTGSTETGRILLRRAADRVLKVAMELGGNAPFIVLADADLDAAVEGAMVAKMRHSAETCTAANRFLVEAPAVEAFTTKLAAAMDAIRVGDGFEDGVECGPLIDERAVEKVDGLVRAAVDDGASVVTGGTPLDRPGSFYAPTVLADVTADSPITRSEIFGPVAPVLGFTDLDRAIQLANDTEAGLTGYVYAGDLGRGLAVSERLQVGMVGLNRGAVSDPAAPFGGMKQSGLGREGASEGIYEFCETQYIATGW